MSYSSIKKLTEEQLQIILINSNNFFAARSNLRLLKYISIEEDQIKKILREKKPTPAYQKLQQVPGVGEILAITIMLETVDINRFEDVSNYSSYCDCVGRKKVSNGKKKDENNTKNGNKYLSWAFVETANLAIIHYPEIKIVLSTEVIETRRSGSH